MVKIIYVEHNGARHEVNVPEGENLMEGAVQNMVPGIEAECGGGCACATCQVYVDASWRDHFPAAEDMETEMLSFAPHVQAESRLGCQLRVTEETDGLVVRMPESQY